MEVAKSVSFPQLFRLSPTTTYHTGKNDAVKPAAHLRKELSKLPREAISSAVSSSVRLSFREFFASRGREENIYHV